MRAEPADDVCAVIETLHREVPRWSCDRVDRQTRVRIGPRHELRARQYRVSVLHGYLRTVVAYPSRSAERHG